MSSTTDFSPQEPVSRPRETERDILMNILNKHMDDKDTLKSQRRRSMTSKTSKGTAKSSVKRNSVHRKEKVGHVRIVSQTSFTTIEIPPTPPPKPQRPRTPPPRRSSRRTSHTPKPEAQATTSHPKPSPSSQFMPTPSPPPTKPKKRPHALRPTHDLELPSHTHPSCISLPPTWNTVHDRFIAYLSTHAPLDHQGKVPANEASRERWSVEDITKIVGERFELGGIPLRAAAVELRLRLLDESGDNDFFQKRYGAYRGEKWGWGV
ncbi:hypothetical protein GLAREA_05641 [Glarea lozoyensis ATCC 20868]|uniref:Uncharacterized protein n=1 Tax=Glarea lozoyensis (strain ATCC 20868 / MF5171) TaxID=1116229 RepID=S3EDE6_GLAL2|nr:uncharacterized protein GLAREA_05641 [Glarea lozoyensis ATCC 20868]EPE36303.1 hypothetical protein GLAREA_05641 [Glarea lozoyensis ATCC 20868]